MSVFIETVAQDAAEALPRRSLGREMLIFLAIGAAAAASFVVLSYLVVHARTGLPDWLASTFCYAAFIVPVYRLHRRFSFRSEAPHGHALPRYVAVQLVALCLASIFSYLLYGVFGLQSWVAPILVIVLTSGLNFVVLRAWAFAVHR